MYEFILLAVALCASVSILGQFTYVRVNVKALEKYTGGSLSFTAKLILYTITFIGFFFLAPFVFIACLTGPSQVSIDEYCKKYAHIIPKNNS